MKKTMKKLRSKIILKNINNNKNIKMSYQSVWNVGSMMALFHN